MTWMQWRRQAFSINVGLLVLLIGLIAFFAMLAGSGFLSLRTASAFAYEMPELGVLSLAMMVAMISGGLNLSIVSTANICALTMGWLLTVLPAHQTGAVWVIAIAASVAAGFLVAAAIGLVTGYIIAFVGVSPILTTLGMMTLLKGLAVGVTRGNIVSGFPKPIVFIGNGTILGFPMPLLVFLACAIPVSVLLTRSPFGLSVTMIGSNERAAYYSGVDTRRTLVKVYVLSSLLACVAGVILMARFNSANASYGGSYLLVTVLACVLGGVDPYGGFGRTSGVVLALTVLQVISSAFNVLGFNAFLALTVWGMVLIVTSAVASWNRR
jgi:ribose/xylose/arabinose/galactoside ABC-type transport system permease subunit